MISWSLHLSTVLAAYPVVDRPAAAAAAGATQVESWWIEPPDQEAWLAAVTAEGLAVTLINARAGNVAAGERGHLNVPARRDAVLADLADAIAFAARAGAPRVNVLAGIVHDELPVPDQLEHAAGVLEEVAPRAAAAGVTLVVEPINAVDIPGSLVPDVAAAAALVQRVGHPAVRLLFDAYHAAASGADPIRELRAHAALVGHVQYADHPGRGPAGTGTIDLPALVRALRDVGYDGPVGLEHLGDPEDPIGAGRAALAAAARAATA